MSNKGPSPLLREGLAGRLADDVRARISREEIAPGSRLPTEAEIARQYGVSRTVVREAISRLRADGLVAARPGAGTFVAKAGVIGSFRIDSSQARQPHLEVVELRVAFEVEAARLAANRRTEDDLAELRRCVAEMSQDVAGTDTGIAADTSFHRAIAIATGNPLFGDFFCFIEPHIRHEIRVARERTARLSHRRAVGRWLQAQSEHVAILAAIEARKPARAAAAARLHLRNTVKRLLPAD